MALPAKTLPYQNPNYPAIHMGSIAVTTTKTIDLKIGHNNFLVFLSIVGGSSAISTPPGIDWNYGTRKGTFVISVSAALTVSFLALVTNAVVQP